LARPSAEERRQREVCLAGINVSGEMELMSIV